MRKHAPWPIMVLSILMAALLLPAQAYRGKGRLRGRITDTEGQPVAQATVKLFHVKSGSGFEVKTDDLGEWTGNWLSHGLWYLDFEKEGFIPKRISLQLQEMAKNPDCDISLKKSATPLMAEEILDQLEKGNALYAEGKYEQAVSEYQAILDKRPEFFQVNLNIGNVFMKKEDYAGAMPYYQKVLDKDPANAEALISLGSCHVELKDFAKALEAFGRIDMEDITDPVVLYNIATIFYNNGEPGKAASYWAHSLKVKSDFIDSYYQLGLAYLGLNEGPAALAVFKKYLELDPSSERAGQVRNFIEYLEKK